MRLQVGASTGIMARAVVKINPSASLRVNVRAGTAGIEAEVGVLARFSEFNTGSLSVATGLQVSAGQLNLLGASQCRAAAHANVRHVPRALHGSCLKQPSNLGSLYLRAVHTWRTCCIAI